MRKASIDIGSNSVLLLVADVDGEVVIPLREEQRVTRLGRGIEKTGLLRSESMSDTKKTIVEYLDIAKSKYGIGKGDIVITATEAARVAKNGKSFFNELLNELGVSVSIISGAQEAYYTALGTVSDDALLSNAGEFVIVDIGGASTEFIRVKKTPFEIVSSVSIPLGSVRADEWMNDGVLDKKIESLLVESVISSYKGFETVAVAGTYTSLSAMNLGLVSFDKDSVHNSKITTGELNTLVEKIKNRSVSQLAKDYVHLDKRAEVIVAGGLVALAIAKKLSISKYTVSCRGLRYGTILMNENDFIGP